MALLLHLPLSGPLAESPSPASERITSFPPAATETDQSSAEVQERRAGFSAVWRTAAPPAGHDTDPSNGAAEEIVAVTCAPTQRGVDVYAETGILRRSCFYGTNGKESREN